MTPSLVMAAGLETACNQVLRLDPEILVQLAALDGAVIAIELQGLGLCLCLYLFPGPGGLRVAEDYAGEPTVRIRGTPLALARQWRGQRDPGVSIEGDAATGRAFQAVLARLNIDWEEQFSRWLGDAAAHQLGRVWRELRQWGASSGATLLHDGSEYLQQEALLLPARPALEQFLREVDILREDADRLAARVARLRQRMMPGDPA